MHFYIRTAFNFLLFSFFVSEALGQSGTPQLWYLQNAYLNNPATDLGAIEAQIDQAYSYGYTGVALWSGSFDFMGSTVNPATTVTYLQQIVNHAQSKGMQTLGLVTSFGWDDNALVNNPNWAEGEHLTGSQFTVNAAKTALVPVNSFGGLLNPGFESGLSGWFDIGDPNMGIDTTVSHSGGASGYVTNATGNSRFRQTLNVIPWRQYHGRVWMKTSNFHGYGQIAVTDGATGTMCFQTDIQQAATQDWTAVDFTFNSRGSSQPALAFGIWGGSSGTIWFDDIFIEETALVYVLRRPGTPLKVYNPASPNTAYVEGTDFNAIADPQLSSGAKFPYQGFYHAPGVVTLPATTSLLPGQTVAIDYYAVQPITAQGDVGICLTDTGPQNWLQQNAQNIVADMPAGMNFLLGYDEMRHMNSCSSCKAKNMTPGQLLGSHVASTVNLFHTLAPAASLYSWSDMFDPYHNAVNNYYYVEGNLAGSWTGLPSNVIVMNWNLANLKNSLTWFSGLNSQQPVAHRQVISGYYDSGDGAASATQELQQATGIPGVQGLMYSTYVSDYSQLQAFATAAKSGWRNYLDSVVTNVTQQVSVSASVVTLNRLTGRYSQTVKLTNNGAALPAAAYVMDSLPEGVAVYQPDGVTSAALPSGSSYREAGPLGAGGSVSITIQFTRTGTQAITYTGRLLGAGPR